MAIFQPPPTYALPILVDEKTKVATFNPIWLRWFLDLEQWLDDAGGPSFEPSVTIVANQVFGEKGQMAQPQVKRLRNDAQMILAGQVFGEG